MFLISSGLDSLTNSASAQVSTDYRFSSCLLRIEAYRAAALSGSSTISGSMNLQSARAQVHDCVGQYYTLVNQNPGQCGNAIAYANLASGIAPIAAGNVVSACQNIAQRVQERTSTRPVYRPVQPPISRTPLSTNRTTPPNPTTTRTSSSGSSSSVYDDDNIVITTARSSSSAHSLWLLDGAVQRLDGFFLAGEAIYGECDRDCADLDINLYDSSGRLVDSDTLSDAQPVVVAPYEGNFVVEVVMHECTYPSGCSTSIDSEHGF